MTSRRQKQQIGVVAVLRNATRGNRPHPQDLDDLARLHVPADIIRWTEAEANVLANEFDPSDRTTWTRLNRKAEKVAMPIVNEIDRRGEVDVDGAAVADEAQRLGRRGVQVTSDGDVQIESTGLRSTSVDDKPSVPWRQ